MLWCWALWPTQIAPKPPAGAALRRVSRSFPERRRSHTLGPLWSMCRSRACLLLIVFELPFDGGLDSTMRLVDGDENVVRIIEAEVAQVGRQMVQIGHGKMNARNLRRSS